MTKIILAKKVIYLDTFSPKSTHEIFNASLLIMCSNVFDEVELRTGRGAYESIRNILGGKIPSNVYQKRVFVLGGNGRLALIFRFLFSTLENIIYLTFTPKNTTIIFPFNNLFSIHLINYFNKFLKKRIIIFCHNEMEHLSVDWRANGSFHKIFPWLCHKFFLNPKIKITDGIYFSVLGDILKENLSKIISTDKMEKFISIDHPYIFQNYKIDNVEINYNNYFIGTVGTLSIKKGLNYFESFVKGVILYNKKINISVTGLVSGATRDLEDMGVDLSPQNLSLKRSEFDYRIKKLNIILFFYPKDNYKLTASGAIMDAILHEKPILALRNDYFEYIFSKFGSLGYLVDDTKDMIEVISDIVTNEIAVTVDFQSLKDKFTPQNISKQLKKELIRIEFIKAD